MFFLSLTKIFLDSIPCTLIYRRSFHRPSDLYFILPHPSPPPIIEFNQASSTIIFINSSFSYLTLHEVSDPILRIEGKNLGSCEIQLEAKSIQPFSGEYTNLITIFNATVIEKEDNNIFERKEDDGRIFGEKEKTDEQEKNKDNMTEEEDEGELAMKGRTVTEYIACPGQIEFGLEDYFWGPALEYNYENSLKKGGIENNSISPKINKIEKISISLDILQKDVIFSRIKTNPFVDNEILQFIQISVIIYEILFYFLSYNFLFSFSSSFPFFIKFLLLLPLYSCFFLLSLNLLFFFFRITLYIFSNVQLKVQAYLLYVLKMVVLKD